MIHLEILSNTQLSVFMSFWFMWYEAHLFKDMKLFSIHMQFCAFDAFETQYIGISASKYFFFDLLHCYIFFKLWLWKNDYRNIRNTGLQYYIYLNNQSQVKSIRKKLWITFFISLLIALYSMPHLGTFPHLHGNKSTHQLDVLERCHQ